MGNEMFQSYLKIMKDRESVIEELTKQVKEIGEVQIFKVKKNNEESDSERLKNKIISDLQAHTEGFEVQKMKDAVGYKKLLETVHNSRSLVNKAMKPGTATLGEGQTSGSGSLGKLSAHGKFASLGQDYQDRNDYVNRGEGARLARNSERERNEWLLSND